MGSGDIAEQGSCGGAGAEQVWSFTPAQDGVYCVDTRGSSIDPVLYVRASSCDAGAETLCDDDTVGVQAEVELEATAGQRYFIVVDGWMALSGAYQLNVNMGRCGDRVESCTDGLDNDEDGGVDCADPDCASSLDCGAPDGTCAAPYFISGAGIYPGDTTGAAHQETGQCYPASSEEEVWVLQPEVDGTVCLETSFGSYRLDDLYVRSGGCDSSGYQEVVCVHDSGGPGAELAVTAGVPYYVFIDNVNQGSTHPYWLSVRFGACGTAPTVEVCDDGVDNDQDGTPDCLDADCASDVFCLEGVGSCASPFVLKAPWHGEGDLGGSGGTYGGSCGGEGGGEVVWSWTSEVSGTVCLDTRGSAFDTVLYVREANCLGGMEVGCDDNGLGLRSEVEFVAVEGTTYYAFVDARVAESGAYQLNRHDGPCVDRVERCDDGLDNDGDAAVDCADPECHGVAPCLAPSGTCDHPFVVTEPGTYSGNTTGAAALNDGWCRFGDAPEHVWAFETEVDTTVCVELARGSSLEDLYIRTGGCDTGYLEPVCRTGSAGPQAEFAVRAGEPNYVFVDGYHSANFGPYSLSVRFGACGTAPSVEVCDDGVDNDQDGRPDCFDAACASSPACIVGSGVCAEPFEFPGLGRYDGTIDGAAATTSGSCGGAGIEEVWSFAVAEGGPVCVSTVASAYDTVLYVREADCEGGVEVGCNDDTVGTDSQVEFVAEAGVTYFAFVDGHSAGAQLGSYGLDLYAGACGARVELCGDGLDNDANGHVDCGDAGCALEPLCRPGSTAIAVSGQTITLSGTLDGTESSWSRPNESCSQGSGSHFFDTFGIVNDSTQAQTVTITAAWGGDGYLHLFRMPFSKNRLTECVVGDDDFNSTTASQIAERVILPGEVLVVVASTYTAGAVIGPYTIEVRTR